MARLDGNPVERAGIPAIFARWQVAALEYAHQLKIRDEAAKKADDAMNAIKASKEALRAFDLDPDNTDQVNAAFHVYGQQAASMYNETKPEHLPFWYVPPPTGPVREPEPTANSAQIPAPSLETPPPPPMPRIKDIILEYLQMAHDLELGGVKAAEIRAHIENKYATTIHEKTVGMTLYRLLKDGKVRRQGHTWFFVPQTEETKNPGVEAPGLFEEGR